jgi:adenylyltransferase/sulfurtransferase
VSAPGPTPPDRYARQRAIGGFDQDRLAASTVLVLGMGALGNELASHLAIAGVGRLVLADFDVVELTNLHRTLLFEEADLGRFKVDAARDALLKRCPDLRVDIIAGDLRFAVGHGRFRRADVVAGCLDSVEARAAAARSCALAGVPYVDSGTAGLAGEVRFYDARSGACYECGLDGYQRGRVLTRWSCTGLSLRREAPGEAAPALGATSGVVGSHQALGVLLTLVGRPPVFGVAHTYDGRTGRMEASALQRSASCPNHDEPLEVEPWNEGRAATATPEEAARRVPSAVGVRLPHVFVPWAACPDAHRWPVRKPLAALSPADVTCAACGEAATPEMVSTLAVGQPDWDRPLAALGVPPGDVVGVVTPAGTRWIELGGDLDDRLPDTL